MTNKKFFDTFKREVNELLKKYNMIRPDFTGEILIKFNCGGILYITVREQKTFK